MMNSIASTSRLMLTAASRPIRQFVPSVRPPPRLDCTQIVCIRLQHTQSSIAPQPSLVATTQLAVDTSTEDKIIYLDHLHKENPERRKRQNRREDPTIRKQKEWDSILKAIKKSFTTAQLNVLKRHMAIPVSLLDSQLKICGSRKDSLVRAIMIHRFDMDDPRTAISIKKKDKAGKKDKEEVIVVQDIPLHVAYLAFDIAAQKTSDEFQKLRVKITTADSTTEQQAKGVQVNFTGTQSDIEKAIAWLQTFSADICIEKGKITSIISSSWYDVSDVAELDKIARSSNSIITIDDDPSHELTIYSINGTWLKEAKRMLAKYQHHLLEIKDRSLLTYASTYSSDISDSFPAMYALQPFLQRYVSDDQIEPDYFRLARQDRPVIEERPKVLRSIDGADEFEMQIFSKLQQQVQERSDRSLESLTKLESLTYTAEFGHLLFKSAEENGEVLPEAPFNEQAILERASSWLSNDVKHAKQTNKAPANGPRFVAAVPPSAANIEGPPDKFRQDQEDARFPDGVQDILDSIKPRKSRVELTLNEMVRDVKKFDEYLAIRYTAGDELLEIRIVAKEKTDDALQGKASLMKEIFGEKDESPDSVLETGDNLLREDEENDDNEATYEHELSDNALQYSEKLKGKGDVDIDHQRLFKLKLESVKQILSKQADVLIPEAATDVRLRVESARLAPQKEVEEIEEWQQFMNQISPQDTFMGKKALFDSVKTVSAPTLLKFGGKQYSLLDQVVVNEWRWRVARDGVSNSDYNTRAVLQIEKQNSPCSSRASQKRFSLAWRRPTRREAVAPQTTVWEVAEPIIKAALSENYKDGQSN